jgi:parallel beta-helix repeat protein
MDIAATQQSNATSRLTRSRTSMTAVAIASLIVLGLVSRVRADSLAIDFENPTYTLGSINGQDGWSATGAYDYGVVATSGFGSPTGFAAQSFRISNAMTSLSFGDWAFSKSLTDEAGEPGADNGGFSGGTRQPHFEVSFDIASAVPNAQQPGLQVSVAPDRGDGARMSYLRFSDMPSGLEIDFDDYEDFAPFGTDSNLAAGCSGTDNFVETTVASGLDRSVPHHIQLVIDFVPGPRNDVVRVFVDNKLVHCGTTWEDYYRYCTESQPPVDVSRTVDSLLLQARAGSGTAPATLGKGFLFDNLDLESGPLVSVPAVCPTSTVQCAAPACATPNCFVNDATGVDAVGCCTNATPCKTIQFAVNDVSVGDVISVAAGTYLEPGTPGSPLNINKTVTLCGAQAGVDARTRAGSETRIQDPEGTVVNANDVVIDGFTIEDNTASLPLGYGLDMGQGTTGTQVYNDIVQNNIVGIGLANTGVSQVRICQNLIQNNNNAGPATGAGIYTDEYVCGFALPCTNFLVDDNTFKGNTDAGIDISDTNPPNPLTQLEVSTNTFDMNGRGIFLNDTDMSSIHNNTITNSTTAGSGAIRIYGGVDDLSITNNELNNGAGWGIRITDDFGPPNSGVVIHENNITNFTGDGGSFGGGLFVGAGAHTGPVNAECNWWGDPCGPYNVAANPGGIGQEVKEAGAPGDADFIDWLIAAGPAPASGSGTCTGTPCLAGTTSTTTTTTVVSSTTTTTQCVPTGPENTSPTCSDMIDNDCNGLIDCADPSCSGIFPCPPAKKDPTIITFSRTGLDQIRGHAKLETPPVDISTMNVGVLLSGPHGAIYSGSLPAGALTATGTIFRYRNAAARTAGGIHGLKIKQNRGGSYTFSFAAYADLSAATDPNLRLQFYLGEDPNAAADGRVFITLDKPWSQTPRGWRAPKDH